jgi:hypothetical protein
MSCPSKKKHVLGWWLGAAVLVVVDAFVPVLSGLLTCLTPQKKMSWVGGLVLSYWVVVDAFVPVLKAEGSLILVLVS